MELISKLWKNFKVQPEIWFFYGFLLTFTLTIRKVLFFFPLRGEFNEYTGIYLYLSDIFLGLTMLAWIITILYNKIDLLSMLKNVPPQKQKDCSTWNNLLLRGKRETLIYMLLPLVLVVWSCISIIWGENKIVAIFRSIKMLELYLLYIFILVRLFHPHTQNDSSIPLPIDKVNKSLGVGVNWNVPPASPAGGRGTILKKIFGLIIIIGLFQAIIGIIQFILQHSIGLFWLKESLISPDISGVAKVIFNGETFIRAYGLFPHPNILGGFLLFSILISLFYYKMFHVEQYDKNKNVPRGTIIKISLGIQLLGLILTFSKSAILGLILGMVYYVYKNVPPAYRQAGVEQYTGQARNKIGALIIFIKKKKRLIIASSMIIVFSFIIAKPNLHSFFIKSLNDRLVYVNVSRGTIWNNPILGIGNGQFVISMANLPVIKESWMLEPVHNVFLLVWSELGIIGPLLLVLFIGYVFKIVPPAYRQAGVEQSTWQAWNMSKMTKTFGAIFIGLLFIMFFDHYLWDIQQGSFLLWMTMGFLVGSGGTGDNLTK